MFDWQPTTTYDLVFFGFVVSHIPPDRFDAFWDLVRRCLEPTGRIAFVDEGAPVAHYDDSRVEDGAPLARQRLAHGREFDIVKIFWEAAELESRLRRLGWDITIQSRDDGCLFGVGTAHRA